MNYYRKAFMYYLLLCSTANTMRSNLTRTKAYIESNYTFLKALPLYSPSLWKALSFNLQRFGNAFINIKMKYHEYK